MLLPSVFILIILASKLYGVNATIIIFVFVFSFLFLLFFLFLFLATAYVSIQSLQNHADKIVLQADCFTSRSCLDRLHWLLVAQRSNFKLMWLVANILTTGQPAYLHDLLSIRRPHESFRSSQSGPLLHQPVSSNLFAHRSFPILPLAYGTLFHTTSARQPRCETSINN